MSGRDAIPLAAFDDLTGVPGTWRTRLHAIRRAGLLLTALVALLALLPIGACESQVAAETPGAVILLVLDRSGSMERDDMVWEGVRTPRLDVARRVASEALLQTQRGADRVGLVTFAGRPRVDAVPTRDTSRVEAALSQVEPTRRLRDDGTAIGDALQAALRTFDEAAPLPSDGGPERLLILLTDGAQNAGETAIGDVVPAMTAAYCTTYVVRLRAKPTADDALATLATATGGRAFDADDTTSLKQAFGAIVEAERRPVASDPVRTRTSWATESTLFASVPLPPLLVAAGVLSVILLILQQSVAGVRPR